jgi:hypothetical protein
LREPDCEDGPEQLTCHRHGRVSQRAQPRTPGGQDGRGQPKPILANVITVLKSGTQFFNLRWDDFSQFAYLGDSRVEDGDVLNITNWVQHNRVHASTSVVKEGIEAVARECRFNQVKEYLEGLKWDGIERLPMLFVENGMADDTLVNRAFPTRWFISAVARALKPGCQADCMLILQGAQGLRKSSFFRTIGEPWFTSHLSDLSTRDSRGPRPLAERGTGRRARSHASRHCRGGGDQRLT